MKRASLSSLHQNSTSPTSQVSIVDKLWKPFRRKSAPNSPELGSRSPLGSSTEPPSSGVGSVSDMRSVILNIEPSSPSPLSNKNALSLQCDFNLTNPTADLVVCVPFLRCILYDNISILVITIVGWLQFFYCLFPFSCNIQYPVCFNWRLKFSHCYDCFHLFCLSSASFLMHEYVN